jgi:hypothetical protein
MSFAPSWSRTVVYALPSEDHRDVDALVLRAGLDEDVDARLVGLRRDVDVPGRAALHALPILPDVIGPEGRLVEIGYLLKEARSISSSMGRLRHPLASIVSAPSILPIFTSFPMVLVGY